MKLFDHQVQARDFILQRGGSGALYLDMGCGKTLIALQIFEALKKDSLKMIVIAPLSLLESAWGDDIKRFTSFTYHNAHDKGVPERLDKDILVINYEAILSKKNKHLFDLIKGNMLILDESSRCKNYKSKTTKILLAEKKRPKYKILLSGCPAPNSQMEFWGQLEFLQEGILHKSFFGFRNTYFHLCRGNQRMNLHGQMMTRGSMHELMTHGWEYDISEENLKKMMERINPFIFWAKKKECLTLPPQVDEKRYIELTPEQRKYYKEMKDDLITWIKDKAVTATIALAKLMKLREINAGFCFSEKGLVTIGKSAKLKELMNIIEEAGNQPLIIWGCFKWTIETIYNALIEKYGEGSAVTLYSGTKDHNKSIRDFKEGRTRFLVANPASAAHGLTFINSSTQIFYELDYSHERHTQARARIHRIGQKNKCTYIYILARDTIDEDILLALQKKENMEKVVYTMLTEGI